MALYVTRPRRDEERIGRGLPSGPRSDVVYGICRGLPSDANVMPIILSPVSRWVNVCPTWFKGIRLSMSYELE